MGGYFVDTRSHPENPGQRERVAQELSGLGGFVAAFCTGSAWWWNVRNSGPGIPRPA